MSNRDRSSGVRIIYHYTYDAWNRMTKVTKAFKECGDSAGGVGSNGTNGVTLGALQLGSVVNEIQYDGLHRRIVKEVKNSADLDMTYHYYYNNQSMVEIHNGSEQVIQQFTWGAMYIDELVEIAVNDDPAGGSENDCESFYYPQHNANYNIIGLTDASGNLVERYEYTPYGQRQVYKSAGINDPDAHAPLHIGSRVEVAGIAQPYALNPIGHQGLLHDEATGLVYNRARMLNPRLQRFNQRDPLGYVDGLNPYVYVRLNSIKRRDPSGLFSQDPIIFCNANCEHSRNYSECYQDCMRALLNKPRHGRPTVQPPPPNGPPNNPPYVDPGEYTHEGEIEIDDSCSGFVHVEFWSNSYNKSKYWNLPNIGITYPTDWAMVYWPDGTQTMFKIPNGSKVLIKCIFDDKYKFCDGMVTVSDNSNVPFTPAPTYNTPDNGWTPAQWKWPPPPNKIRSPRIE